MRKFWKKTIVSVLGIALISTAVVGGVSVVEDDSVNASASTTVDQTFDKSNIVLTVGVITDPHIGYTNSADAAGFTNIEKLQTALSRMQAIGGLASGLQAGKAAEDCDLDALISAGDNTQNGTAAEAQQFIETLKTATSGSIMGDHIAIDPTKTPVIAAHGNHDVYWSGCMDRETFYNTYDALGMYKFDKDLDAAKSGNRHVEVNGYHFLTVDIETYLPNENTLSATTETWLQSKLETISAENPGEPIFVISHSPAMNTIYGSILAEAGYGDITQDDSTAEWGASVALDNILKNYPQVINISGHTHYASNHELSIMQTTYTSFTPGGCADLDANTDTAETQSAMPNPRTYSQSAVLEVDVNNNVCITRIDNIKNTPIREQIIIPAPKADNSHLIPYSYTRGETNSAPTFADGAAPSISVSGTTATVTYPKASDDDMVYSYRITVKDAKGATLSTVTTLAPWIDYPNLANIPDTLSYAFSGVSYTASDVGAIEVVAIDCWAKESAPLYKFYKAPGVGYGIIDSDNTVSVSSLANGYVQISGMDAEGERVYYNDLVTLDGLSVSFYSTAVSGKQLGFYFGSPSIDVQKPYWNETGNTTQFAAINYQYPGYDQNRLHLTTYRTNTAPNAASVVYPDADCTSVNSSGNPTGFQLATSHVADYTEGALIGYNVTFTSYNDYVYAITVKMTHGIMWGNPNATSPQKNCNYDLTTDTSTVYLPKSALADTVDANGKVRLYFASLSTSSLYAKVEDNGARNSNAVYDYEGANQGATNGVFSGYSYKSATLSATYSETDDEYTTLAGFAGYTAQATRFVYNRRMAIDGLSVTMKFTTGTGVNVRDAMGFILTGDNTGNVWYGYNSNYPTIEQAAFAVTNWTNIYQNGSQDRLHISNTHDDAYSPIIYNRPYATIHTGLCACKTADGKTEQSVCSQRHFGNSTTHTYIANHEETNEYTITFRVYDENWYAIDIVCPNRNSAQPAENGVTTVYMPTSTLSGIVDEAGYVYVMFAGFTSGENPASSMDVKVTNVKAEEWLAKYEEAIVNGADALTLARYRAVVADTLMTLPNEQRQAYNVQLLALDEKRTAIADGVSKTMSMTVSSDLIVNHYVYLPVAIEAESIEGTWTYGGETVELTGKSLGRVTEEYSFEDPVTGATKTSSKTFVKYAFNIDALRPQCMTDTITLDFYAKDGNGETLVHTTVSDWTMKSYLEGFVDGDVDTALEKLVVDLLDYGAAAQTYVEYETDALANATYTTTVDETALVENVSNVTNVKMTNIDGENEVKFTSATLTLRDKVMMRAKLVVADLTDAETGEVTVSGATYAAGLTATVTIGGRVYDAVTGEEVTDGNTALTTLKALSTNYLYLYDIMPTQYDETVTFKVYKGDTLVVTLTYSVHSYVANKYNEKDDSNNDTANAALTKALWAVGYSAEEYLLSLNA
ncbi:MAG: metallophosphoesterase [Clostridia bacterium]|nr:metallophosphoesterase [Clostridia bacterium]